LSLTLAAPLAAQVMPQPGSDTPRVQTVQFVPDQSVLLTMLPETPLTVMLPPGETITGATPGAGEDFRVRVSSERNSFIVLPAGNAGRGTLDIVTQQRTYRFALRVENGYSAALLVRFVGDPAAASYDYADMPEAELQSPQTWLYSLRGDRAVRPEHLTDDGMKTRIAYAPGQALPAVFAIGPSGEEEVVNGYMRDGIFVIDRVYDELVFRIDREKATARRNDAPEATP
jgi:type IV secretion system protein VirB9